MMRQLFPAVSLLLSCATLADDASRQAPVSLHATRIEIDQKTGVSRYLGKVAVTQGTLRFTADRVTVERQGELLKRVVAEGNPATFRDLPEGQVEYVEGKALRMEYEALDRRLHLVGQAEAQQGTDRIEAGELHYNMNTETFSARTLENRRVIATVNPQRKPVDTGDAP